MGELFGWMGKMLRVNLSDGSTSTFSTRDYITRFIGGRGVATRLYWDETGPATGALEGENHLFFMNGPLSGTQACHDQQPKNRRFHISAPPHPP